MTFLRWLLLPFSILYAIGVWCRNRLYDWGLFRQTGFDVPILVVGNLEVGGTGKTPMIEYLIRLLADRHRVATLSRGYRRRTRGYLELNPHTTADEAGDEPVQFKQKFPAITVAVDENRVRGASRLKDTHDVLLLDDAFQHRAIRPGLSILLFDFNRLSRPKLTFPTGDYRDGFGERHRADILVVTKCPESLSTHERHRIRTKLATRRREKGSPILFAYLAYGAPVRMPIACDGGEGARTSGWPHASSPEWDRNGDSTPLDGTSIVLVTGIARPAPLKAYLARPGRRIDHLIFPDHHRFSTADIQLIQQRFTALTGEQKIILTTEKDAKRLGEARFRDMLQGLPIYYIPIRMAFFDEDRSIFDRMITGFVDQN